jgi:hypothetical protein
MSIVIPLICNIHTMGLILFVDGVRKRGSISGTLTYVDISYWAA